MSADNFWDNLPRTMALCGLNPTKAGFIRQDLKLWTLYLFAELEEVYEHETAEEVKGLVRKWITGTPS